MKDSIKDNVKTLLEADLECRDDDGYLASVYNYHFLHMKDSDFILSNKQHQITNARKDLQHDNPKLRGKRYEERQKHCNTFRQERAKTRSQEKPERLEEIYTGPEDVSHIFEKETKYQWIIRKLLNF